jgi:hypothetical protein
VMTGGRVPPAGHEAAGVVNQKDHFQ